MVDFVDRRLNPGGKSLPNRQRFLDRAMPDVKRAVEAGAKTRSLSGGEAEADRVKVTGDGTREPFLRHGKAGQRGMVLPGNKTFQPGDEIPLPQGGGGGGGSQAGTGDGVDSFEFVLTRKEMLDTLLDGLELPDLELRSAGQMPESRPQRAGLSVSGTPAALNLGRTMRKSLGRRVALGGSKRAEINALHAAIDEAVGTGDDAELARLREALAELLSRRSAVPFLDPIDLRYNRFEVQPQPRARAVMFCLLDVSWSMDETKKELAKRFFLLTYIFLERRYKEVALVFIRHTDTAAEVDEHTFFYDKSNGGTKASTALEEMTRIQRDRFPLADWNIYAVQAGDGDNAYDDGPRVTQLMQEAILPVVQQFAYIETQPRSDGTSYYKTSLWSTFEALGQEGHAARLAMHQVGDVPEVLAKFRELFRPRAKAA